MNIHGDIESKMLYVFYKLSGRYAFSGRELASRLANIFNDIVDGYKGR